MEVCGSLSKWSMALLVSRRLPEATMICALSPAGFIAAIWAGTTFSCVSVG